MKLLSDGVCGVVALIFGVYVIATKRLTIGEDCEDVQMWLYGWRAIAVGSAAVAVAILCFASALGIIHLDGF